MLMNWSSPFVEEKKKKKITNPKQLEQIDDELMDYTPPKEKKEPENVYETPLFEYQKPPDSALIEKLNYMIYLLEEQRDEKTGQITEELILYVFLGVFTLFVLDSFVKHGKYTR
jgi:hypothetical protein